MSVHLVPVTTDDDVLELAALAKTIWFEYWPDLIGPDQTAYMVEKYQSVDAIRQAMANDAYEYWFIEVDDEDAPDEAIRVESSDEAAEDATLTHDMLLPRTYRIVGYTGGHVEPETNRFFLSKIYLLASQRGRHYSSEAIRFYENLCRERGLRGMYLTVNKHNNIAIRAYKAKGFKTIDSVVTDIGSGFVMDDYIMELDVD